MWCQHFAGDANRGTASVIHRTQAARISGTYPPGHFGKGSWLRSARVSLAGGLVRNPPHHFLVQTRGNQHEERGGRMSASSCGHPCQHAHHPTTQRHQYVHPTPTDRPHPTTTTKRLLAKLSMQ